MTSKTASTLTFIVYMLSEHPDILRRLRQEILEKVGPQRRPTYDNFRDMKYLRAVINGALVSSIRINILMPVSILSSNRNLEAVSCRVGASTA